jgi:hypothetical protein
LDQNEATTGSLLTAISLVRDTDYKSSDEYKQLHRALSMHVNVNDSDVGIVAKNHSRRTIFSRSTPERGPTLGSRKLSALAVQRA